MILFRTYQPSDRERCLALFDANCPAFFAANERDDYLTFLAEASDYQVCCLDDRIVGAYGLAAADSTDGTALRWILLSPEMQGRGIGSTIMARVLQELHARQISRLHIAASHKSAPFFRRFGADEVAAIANGWGPGMDRIDMILRVG